MSGGATHSKFATSQDTSEFAGTASRALAAIIKRTTKDLQYESANRELFSQV